MVRYNKDEQLAFELFCTFKSIKLHFEQDNYDCIRYKFKTNCKIEDWSKSKLKPICFTLKRALGDNFKYFALANILVYQSCTLFDLKNVQSARIYKEWQERVVNLENTFRTELSLIEKNDFEPSVNSRLFILNKQGEISLETLVILNKLFGWTDKWMTNNQIKRNLIMTNWFRKIRKYQTLLDFNPVAMKTIFRQVKGEND